MEREEVKVNRFQSQLDCRFAEQSLRQILRMFDTLLWIAKYGGLKKDHAGDLTKDVSHRPKLGGLSVSAHRVRKFCWNTGRMMLGGGEREETIQLDNNANVVRDWFVANGMMGSTEEYLMAAAAGHQQMVTGAGKEKQNGQEVGGEMTQNMR
jgi:hypothetical protein